MKDVVFIPNIDLGNGRSDKYSYCINSWKSWCDKNDCELIEWKDPIMDPDQFPIIMTVQTSLMKQMVSMLL